MFQNLNIHVNKEIKLLCGRHDLAKTALFQILMGELPADSGFLNGEFHIADVFSQG